MTVFADGRTAVMNPAAIAGATGPAGRPTPSRFRAPPHLSLMDVPFLPLTPESPVGPMLAATTIDPATMLAVVRTLVVAFLSGADMTEVLASDLVKGSTTPLASDA